MTSARRSFAAAGLLALALTLGCTEPQGARVPSGATCPPDSTLTYDNFGRPFMETYCVRCHSSELHGAARNGAPLYHDFDSLFGIIVVADHVDEYTAAGPDSTNTRMPPDGAKPTMDERVDLGEWLACEVENFDNNPPDAGAAADAGIDATP